MVEALNGVQQGTQPGDGEGLSDEELLVACSAERRQSAGFEEDWILLNERALALDYAKGVMPDLVPLENRSKVVSTDVSDQIEEALPDLMEIFTGGDDVLAFQPNGPDDEKAAQQETDYVKHVIFSENNGFKILYDLFKDAMQMKVGVAIAWWEDREPQIEDFTGKTDIEVLQATQSSKVVDLRPDPADEDGGPQTYSFTAIKKRRGRCRVETMPPEDFTVARDTVNLAEGTYCAWRARPRAQELLLRGIPREIVDSLPAYGTTYDETLRLARDTAGEYFDQRSVTGYHDLRQVEIITHFIRIDADGSGPALWKIETGAAETVLISKERLQALNVAGGTPYPVPHRWYGESVADKLLEIQRQKTALKRIMFDSAYFALNQRNEVAMDKANEWTISDLLRIEPGMPVRSKTGDAVRAIESGALNFDVLAALEASSVEGETRTGIVRSANGLAPDSLHETAHGMLALLQAAQKRLRLMAQIFAEGMLRDLYLIVHRLLREHADQEAIIKIRGEWVPIDPTTWGERDAMTIQVGQGSAGMQAEVQILQVIAALQEKIVQAMMAIPGAPPIVTAQNVYNLAARITEKSGEKSPELFFTDPAKAPPPQPGAPGQPPPNPQMAKVQADREQAEKDREQKGQVEAGKLQLSQQDQMFAQGMDQQRFQAEQQTKQGELALKARQLELDDQFRREQLASTERVKMHETGVRAQLMREGYAASFAQAVTVQHMKDQNDAQQRVVDVATDRLHAKDAAEMAEDQHGHEADMAKAAARQPAQNEGG